jgi:hypothetical protein
MSVYNVSFSENAARLVLNYFRGTATPTAPTALYVALLTGTATDTDTGGGFTEFTGYTATGAITPAEDRMLITFGAAATAGTGTLATAQRITSSNAPSAGITTAGPTIISGIAITTALKKSGVSVVPLNYNAAGNVIFYGELTTGTPPSQTATTVSVVSTDTLTFSAGNITIDLY